MNLVVNREDESCMKASIIFLYEYNSILYTEGNTYGISDIPVI